MRATALALVATLGGCGPDEVVPPRPVADAASERADAASADAAPGAWTVFTIVLENHDYDEIIGSADAPYVNALRPMALLATDYHDVAPRSLPNYLTMASGDAQGVTTTNVLPTQAPFPVAAPSLGGALTTGGVWWRAYQQGMGAPCTLGNVGRYVVRHNPFVYFVDGVGDAAACARTIVDLAELADDLVANRPRFAWLQPDLVDGGHDPGGDPPAALRASDAWLAATLPAVLASPGYVNGGVVIVTWDEAMGRDGRSATKLPLLMLSPRLLAPGTTVDAPLDHRAYLATVLDVLGLPRLPAVADAPSLADRLAAP